MNFHTRIYIIPGGEMQGGMSTQKMSDFCEWLQMNNIQHLPAIKIINSVITNKLITKNTKKLL